MSLTREECSAVCEDVACGKSLTEALSARGYQRVQWVRAKARWPDIQAEYEAADRDNAEWMFEQCEQPVKLAVAGKISADVAKLWVDQARWRLKVKHRARFGDQKAVDLTTGGDKLPAVTISPTAAKL